jgi:hypothetical protein
VVNKTSQNLYQLQNALKKEIVKLNLPISNKANKSIRWSLINSWTKDKPLIPPSHTFKTLYIWECFFTGAWPIWFVVQNYVLESESTLKHGPVTVPEEYPSCIFYFLCSFLPCILDLVIVKLDKVWSNILLKNIESYNIKYI